MAPEFVLELPAFVSVDPAEDLGELRRAGAVGDAVGPVLGEAVLLGDAFEAGVGDGQLHDHVRFGRLVVVPPQSGKRLVHASFTCKKKHKTLLAHYQIILSDQEMKSRRSHKTNGRLLRKCINNTLKLSALQVNE